jgi:hypothetical protein
VLRCGKRIAKAQILRDDAVERALSTTTESARDGCGLA